MATYKNVSRRQISSSSAISTDGAPGKKLVSDYTRTIDGKTAQRCTAADWGGCEGRRDVPRHACDRGCPAALAPVVRPITTQMAGARVVAALVLGAATAAATNATWCSARNHRRLAGGCVHSLRPALPHAAATRLGALLQRAWQQGGFLYATNCRRSGDACECGNKKMRMSTKDSAPAQAAAVYC